MSASPEESRDKDEGEPRGQSRLALLLAWARTRINWREPGVIVSAGAHAALLAATLIAFADTKTFEDLA